MPPSAGQISGSRRLRPAAPAVHSEATERRRLEQELRDAAARGGFVLHYQPRFDLRSGALLAAEALIRWPHSRRGLISPGAFIPLAEESGAIIDIGGWVLRAACAEAAGWPAGRDGLAPTVSVNVSPRQIRNAVLLAQVTEALEQSALDPERLELELTEAVLADLDLDALLSLFALRDLGVGLAVDDFGTGFASLGMLRRLPLSVMKLDRSLIRAVPGDAEDATIAGASIVIGHALNLTVVAEGVETEAQREFLSGQGCDQGQGYLFGRPAPPGRLPGLTPAWAESCEALTAR